MRTSLGYVAIPNGDAPLKHLLSGGQTLSRLFERRYVGTGSVSAIAPTGSDPADLVRRLSEGGVASAVDAESLLVSGLTSLLSVADNRIAIVEMNAARHGDPWLQELGFDIVFYGDEVYALSASDTSPDDIRAVLRRAGAYPTIAMVAAVDPRPNRGSSIPLETLTQWAETTSAAFVGAFDEESFLCWMR